MAKGVKIGFNPITLQKIGLFLNKFLKTKLKRNTNCTVQSVPECLD